MLWNKFAIEAKTEKNVDNWELHQQLPYREELIQMLICSELKQE